IADTPLQGSCSSVVAAAVAVGQFGIACACTTAGTGAYASSTSASAAGTGTTRTCAKRVIVHQCDDLVVFLFADVATGIRGREGQARNAGFGFTLAYIAIAVGVIDRNVGHDDLQFGNAQAAVLVSIGCCKVGMCAAARARAAALRAAAESAAGTLGSAVLRHGSTSKK